MALRRINIGVGHIFVLSNQGVNNFTRAIGSKAPIGRPIARLGCLQRLLQQDHAQLVDDAHALGRRDELHGGHRPLDGLRLGGVETPPTRGDAQRRACLERLALWN